MIKACLTLLLALALAPLVARAQGTAGVRLYTIDPRASSLQVQVFRQGGLSALAHDHVIVAEGMAGLVNFHRDHVATSTVQLTVPVASLVVDPPEARAKLGLSGNPSDSTRENIRETMLDEAQLDEAQFPRIVATTLTIEGQLPTLVLTLRLRIRGEEQRIPVTVRVEVSDTELHATGTVALKQSDFGVTPYRFLFGMIAVQDEVKVTFDIVARAKG